MKDFDAIHEAFKDETTLAEGESMVFAASAAADVFSSSSRREVFGNFWLHSLYEDFEFSTEKAKEGEANTYEMTFSRHYTYAYKYI